MLNFKKNEKTTKCLEWLIVVIRFELKAMFYFPDMQFLKISENTLYFYLINTCLFK